MPNNAKNDAIARQWELLRLIPPRGSGRTTKELTQALAAGGFEVTQRTVQRDLIDLSRLFPIECNDKSIPYGWRWMQDSEFDLPSLSITDALSLKLVAQYIKPLLPASILKTLESRFNLATSKLAALQPSNRASRWADKVRSVPPALSLIPPQVDLGVLDAVQDALLCDAQLAVEYQAAEADIAATLRLHPLALVQRGPVTYLVATAYEYQDLRLFALHRFSTAEKLPVRAKRPKDFSIDDYIASGALEFGAAPPIKLVANLAAGLAKVLRETPLCADMTLEVGEAGFRLTATVADTWQLRWWILSQAEACTVIRPASLRKEIMKALERATQRYLVET